MTCFILLIICVKTKIKYIAILKNLKIYIFFNLRFAPHVELITLNKWTGCSLPPGYRYINIGSLKSIASTTEYFARVYKKIKVYGVLWLV